MVPSRLSALALFCLSLSVQPAFGGPAEDLVAGQDAVAVGDLQKAASLLRAAAEGLPQSVEAQLALGDVQLKLGQFDDALATYKTVLKLSPNHSLATLIVDSLTRQQVDFEKLMATVEQLMSIQKHYQQAEALLKTIRHTSLDPSQREQIELLRLECKVWQTGSPSVFADALKLAGQTTDETRAAKARVLAGLDAAARQNATEAQLTAVLGNVDNLDASWKSRAQLAKALVAVDPETINDAMLAWLNHLPHSVYRAWVIQHVGNSLLQEARQRAERDDEYAFDLIVPMYEDFQPGMAPDQKPGPGWLEIGSTREAEAEAIRSIVENSIHVLQLCGTIDVRVNGANASLDAFELASEIARRGLPTSHSVDRRLDLAELLASLHQSGAGRAAEQPLNNTDMLQREILLSLGDSCNDKQRRRLVDQVLAQLQRYAQQGDLETCLAQYVTLVPGDNTFDVQLVDGLMSLPPGDERVRLQIQLAAFYQQLGARAFEEANQSLAVDVNETLQLFDRAALTLCANVPESPASADVSSITSQIVARYTSAGKWNAALEAVEVKASHTRQDAGELQVAQLHLQRWQETQRRLMAANRALPDELTNAVKVVLDHLAVVTRANPTKAALEQVRSMVSDQLLADYLQMDRVDLANAVIDYAADPETGLDGEADFVRWTRSRILGHLAEREFQRAIREKQPGELPLVPSHSAEIELLDQIIADAESRYRTAAIQRVRGIASAYQARQSYAAAIQLLRDYLAKHEGIAFNETVAFNIVNMLSEKAQGSFASRQQDEPPTELSADHDAVILELAAFFTAYPESEQTRQVVDVLLATAKTYGAAGAWNVSRTVLDRFAQVMPDYRYPAHLKFMRAATYLGELDQQQGIALLTPSPQLVDPTQDSKRPESMWVATAGAPAPNADPAVTGELPQQTPQFTGPGTGAGGFGGGAGYQGLANETALALIRQSQQRQFERIAMLEQQEGQAQQRGERIPAPAVRLPAGAVLSDAEIQRQNEVSETAYQLLIELVGNADPQQQAVAAAARGQVMWMIGFFNGQQRGDYAITLIERFLKDRPNDAERVQLAYQIVVSKVDWASTRSAADVVNQAWLDERDQRFADARAAIAAFIDAHPTETSWQHRAQSLRIESFRRQSALAAMLSPVRAGGLLVQAVEAMLSVLDSTPNHPETVNFADRVWNTASQISALGQQDQAIYVLNQIPVRFPISDYAKQAILRIAELHATNLSNPLRAVETYQEYLSLNGDDENIRTQIFSIAQQLSAQERYLEAIHVYEGFVDTFPGDPRAAQALYDIGSIHQSNEVWLEAMASYQRILDEFPSAEVIADVKLALANCEINLSRWRAARRTYDNFVQDYPEHDQVALARSRAAILKNVERYQTLIDDQQVQRNKDDAQLQIARIVASQLGSPVKAISEFRKVVTDFPGSNLADDAQIEIGKTLLSLNRLDEAREALLEVPARFPNSPNADDALFLVGKSYEQQAEQLAAVTAQTAWRDAFVANQKQAYQTFNGQLMAQMDFEQSRRVQLKGSGKTQALAVDEATNAFRFRANNLNFICNTAQIAELMTEAQSALQLANRQDRINEAYRESVAAYMRAARDYPLGDKTDDSLLRIAEVFETHLNDRNAAMQTYQNIVKLFPGTPVAEDAAWRVALYYDEEGKYAEASESLREFIRTYPGSNRVADAQFTLAEVLEQLGKWNDAMDAYEIFRQKFAEHPKAQLAAEQINWIKAYRK